MCTRVRPEHLNVFIITDESYRTKFIQLSVFTFFLILRLDYFTMPIRGVIIRCLLISSQIVLLVYSGVELVISFKASGKSSRPLGRKFFSSHQNSKLTNSSATYQPYKDDPSPQHNFSYR